jgi:A/G-specific adenine glycosylase
VSGFARRVIAWQRRHGRTGLPWQDTRDPYRVWLSEIMLQQTQVSTVLGYYARFLARFPDLASLAGAREDDVLALWSGLGYYGRARHLQRCAQEVMSRHGGQFPRSAIALQTLPGIGRSTAAAIAAFCFGERAAILDGNVKRVLARVLGFDADVAIARNERELWDKATSLLPRRPGESMARYTQGLMDLGATVCLPRQPACLGCPACELCVARSTGMPERYPVRTRKPRRSAQVLWLLRARTSEGAVWLEKRPPAGIWGSLHCLPVFESREALAAAVPKSARARLRDRAAFVHVLTHRELHLHPVDARMASLPLRSRQGAWVASGEWPQLGLPAPIRRLLEEPPGH